jgi:hypothetical protein
MDSKERVALAKTMGHSVATSANYKQKKKWHTLRESLTKTHS